MTECKNGEPYSDMENSSIVSDPFACVIVYVLTNHDDPATLERRIEFHKSLGGQGHVRCECNGYPFITTGKLMHKKKKIDERRECMTPDCSKKEYYACSNPSCHGRLCKSCVDRKPCNVVVTLKAPSIEEDLSNNGRETSGEDEQNRYCSDENPTLREVISRRDIVASDENSGLSSEDDTDDDSKNCRKPRRRDPGYLDDFFTDDYLTTTECTECK